MPTPKPSPASRRILRSLCQDGYAHVHQKYGGYACLCTATQFLGGIHSLSWRFLVRWGYVERDEERTARMGAPDQEIWHISAAGVAALAGEET